MKRYWLLFLLFPFVSLVAKVKIDQLENQGYLLSSPASGNTWVRYIIEYLTAIPTGFQHDYPKAISAEIDYSIPMIRKTHGLSKIHESMKLILIVRNYKEIMLRYSTRNLNQEKLVDKNYLNYLLDLVKNREFKYFRHLKLFDEWDETRRHLIYYEDLMTQPQETIMALINFLEVEPRNVDEFFANFDYHSQKVIKLYNDRLTRSRSGGKDLLWHSKKISLHERQKIDRLVKKLYPDLAERYLTRYDETLGD